MHRFSQSSQISSFFSSSFCFSFAYVLVASTQAFFLLFNQLIGAEALWHSCGSFKQLMLDWLLVSRCSIYNLWMLISMLAARVHHIMLAYIYLVLGRKKSDRGPQVCVNDKLLHFLTNLLVLQKTTTNNIISFSCKQFIITSVCIVEASVKNG